MQQIPVPNSSSGADPRSAWLIRGKPSADGCSVRIDVAPALAKGLEEGDGVALLVERNGRTFVTAFASIYRKRGGIDFTEIYFDCIQRLPEELDANAQLAVRQFLRDYNQRFNATILLTSHYMADITALCDRVLTIHQGKLIYDGSLDGLVERFSPKREVTIEFACAYHLAKLQDYGDIHEVDGVRVRFLIAQEMLTKTVSRMLAELSIVDLSVGEPPIEEVIGQVFEAGAV